MHDETLMSLMLLGCDREGQDSSAGRSLTSFAGSPSKSAPVVGTPTGTFLFETTNNLAASTWVGVSGKKLCLVPRAELPGAPGGPHSRPLLRPLSTHVVTAPWVCG